MTGGDYRATGPAVVSPARPGAARITTGGTIRTHRDRPYPLAAPAPIAPPHHTRTKRARTGDFAPDTMERAGGRTRAPILCALHLASALPVPAPLPAALRRFAPLVPALVAFVLWATAPLVVPAVPGPDPTALADAALADADDALTTAWADTDARAHRLARDPAVAAALTGETPEALGALVRRFAATPPPPRVSVEVWRDSLLYAWQGASAQQGGAAGAQFGESAREGLVVTETRTLIRRVEPVEGIDGGRVVVTRTVRETPPVRNASLRPYDLIRTATRARGLDIRLDTARQAGVEDDGGTRSRRSPSPAQAERPCRSDASRPTSPRGRRPSTGASTTCGRSGPS